MIPSKWSTVSFVKDTPKKVRRFVSYHLALGAAHMHLFFDDPEDPSVKMVSHLDRVTPVACDHAFWKSLLNEEERYQRLKDVDFILARVQTGFSVV